MGGFSDFVDDVKRATVGVLTGGLSEVKRALTPDTVQAPGNPADDPVAIKAREKAERDEVLRRLMGGRESTINTSPMGLTGAAPTASKSLLGS